MRNKDAAEDVLQSTLLVAYVNIHKLRDYNAFKSWIFTIAKRESLSYIKKHSRETKYEEINDFYASDIQEAIDEIIATKETKAMVASAISELKNDYRDVLILRFFVDMSIEDISNTLRLNINTVKTRLKRAKCSLANIINKRYRADEDER